MKGNVKRYLAIIGIASFISAGLIATKTINAKDTDNKSTTQKDTQIVTQVPSMETSIKGKKNPVWVPTLHWTANVFAKDILKRDTLQLEKKSNDLNEVQKDIGENNLQSDEYVAMAGLSTKEWVKNLNKEIKVRFPNETDKDFGKTPQYVAYSLIVKDLKFEIPFPKFKNKMDWNGKKIEGWGINSKYGQINEKVPTKNDNKGFENQPVSPLTQVNKLWYNKDENKAADFGIAFNLKDKHKNTKVYVFQYVDNSPKTIKEAWDLAISREKADKYKVISSSFVKSLSIPRLKFSSKKSWSTMCGKIKNSNISISSVQQNIDFNFDNKGAYMRAEAIMCGSAMSQKSLQLDVEKTFFIFMAKDGAKAPYFGMYVNDIDL